MTPGPSKTVVEVLRAIAASELKEFRVRSTIMHGASSGYVPSNPLVQAVSPTHVQMMKRGGYIVLAGGDLKKLGYSRFVMTAKSRRLLAGEKAKADG
jgi:hypothetical protein